MSNGFNELKSEEFVVSDLKSEEFVVSDLKSEICYIPSGYLKKQMGNARFLITRSTSTFENYRLVCKIMKLGRGEEFEEKKFIRMVVDKYGTKRWYLNGKLHRVDKAAIKYSHGSKEWRVGGKLHRVDGPAVIFSNGHKEWWFEGKRHRVGEPAIEWPDGRKEWWVNGERKD